MTDPFTRAWHFLHRELWDVDVGAMPRWQKWTYSGLRMFYVLVRELTEGQLALHAMSLVYTTLLSLVPLLAVSFSVLKAFGVHNQVEPLLLNFLAPLGEQGVEITNRVIRFVENIKVGVLGSVGLAMLIYTVVSLIQKIETSFNFVWRVKQVRSFTRRFSDYLSVIIVGPVLVFAAIGMTASITNNELVQRLLAMEPLGTAVLVLGRIMPYLLISAAFTFFYMFVPNTTVHLRSAAVGGLVGGALWQLTGYVFAAFASGSTRYEAIYSSFAIIILFMIWLYLSWFILLFGSQIAYFHQHPQLIRRRSERFRFSARLRDRVGLAMIYLTAHAYQEGEQGWSMDDLVKRLGVPGDALGDLLDDMLQLGFLVETSGDPALYLPGIDPDRLTVREVIAGLRSAGEQGLPIDEGALTLAPVEHTLAELQAAGADRLGNMTIGDLVRQGDLSVASG